MAKINIIEICVKLLNEHKSDSSPQFVVQKLSEFNVSIFKDSFIHTMESDNYHI